MASIQGGLCHTSQGVSTGPSIVAAVQGSRGRDEEGEMSVRYRHVVCKTDTLAQAGSRSRQATYRPRQTGCRR